MQNAFVLFSTPVKPHKCHKSYKPICYAGITKNLLRRHAERELVSHRGGEAARGRLGEVSQRRLSGPETQRHRG